MVVILVLVRRCRSLDMARRSGTLVGAWGRYLLRQFLDIPGRPLADPGVYAQDAEAAEDGAFVAKIGELFFTRQGLPTVSSTPEFHAGIPLALFFTSGILCW
jgi:hypothetical protein